MSERKQTTHEVRRRQIIDGALRVFSTKGFVAATNKDIAEAAGIKSPALIYHYFASKEALLLAAIECHAPPFQVLADADALMPLPLEQALTTIARAVLQIMDDPMIGACQRVLLGEALHSPKFAHILAEAGPLRQWRLLADFLRRKMEQGQLRPMDPDIAARCFIGPLAMQMLAHTVLRLPDAPDVDRAALVAANVEIFLRGLRR